MLIKPVPQNKIFIVSQLLLAYSYLKASNGSNFDAFFAGMYPAIIPTTIETRVAMIVAFRLKVNSNGASRYFDNTKIIICTVTVPKTIPIIPPTSPIRAALQRKSMSLLSILQMSHITGQLTRPMKTT